MKHAALLFALAICACLVGSMLLAEDAPKPRSDAPAVVKEGDKPKDVRKEGEGKKEEPKQPRLPENVAKIDKVVGGLTDDQKAKVAEFDKARQEAIKAINAKFQADVLALMTPEQKAKWQEASAKPAIKGEGDKKPEGVKKGEGEKRPEGVKKGEGEKRPDGPKD